MQKGRFSATGLSFFKIIHHSSELIAIYRLYIYATVINHYVFARKLTLSGLLFACLPLMSRRQIISRLLQITTACFGAMHPCDQLV